MKKLIFLLFTSFYVIGCAQTDVPRNEERAKTLIDSLYTALTKGSDFKVLAKKFSEDPGSKDQGGLYSDITEGSFVPEFEAAINAVQPTEITKPFRTQYGYHIAQLIQRKGNTYTVRHILIKITQ